MDALSATTANEPARATAPGGGWRFAAADADAALRGPVRTALEELGVIAVTGEDAARFLHGQLTGDIEHLRHDRLALSGYCTAKGRLLATFRVWRDQRAIYLLLPRELLAGVLKRLSMFVLRAKVRLTDDSAAWRVVALFGSNAEAKLREVFGATAAAVGDCVQAETVRVARLHGSARVPDRFLLLAGAGEASPPAALSALPAVDSGAFWWSEIDAGVPTVFAATQERFVPQMINFEVLGGVSFSKGCYPGQEVVARSQYRGKLRRRMALAHAEAAAAAGADVYAEGEAEPAGTVAMAATAPGGGVDLLLECPLEKMSLPLHLGAPDGPALELRRLPYELFDVTA
jgi:folate-binding protein YgfZ